MKGTASSVRFDRSIGDGRQRGTGAPRSARAILVILLLAGCVLFGDAANAACNARGNSPVKVPNWTQFLKQGLSAPSAAPASGQGADPSIVGMWHVFLVSGGQPFDEGYEQWHSDGTEILNDIAPPQAANGSGAICLGTYEKSGPGTYKLRHIGWIFDSNGNLAGYAVITEKVTMDAGGGTFHGTFDFRLYDLSNNLTFDALGTVSATRVTVS